MRNRVSSAYDSIDSELLFRPTGYRMYSKYHFSVSNESHNRQI